MATYDPPLENLPVFDTSVFINGADGLSIAEADARYLRFPQSQGSETINGDLTITGTTTATTITSTGDLLLNPVGSVDMNGKTLNMTSGEIHNCPLIHSQNNNDIVIEGKGTGDVILKTGNTNRLTINDATGLASFANSVSITGNLTAGTFAPATINCDTLNASAAGANQTVGNNLTTGGLNIGNNITTNNINIGASITGAGGVNIGKSSGNGTVGIANLNGSTSTAVEICSGASAFNSSTCVIGKNSALSINNSNGNVNLSTTSQTGSGTLTIANEATSNRTINIGRNNAITVNNAATSIITLTGTTNINTGGSATTQIGNNSTINVNLFGTVRINDSGSQTTTIGNATGATTITNGVIAPTLTAAYLTLNVPYIGATYFSSFSKTGVADSTAYFIMSSANAWNTYSGTSWDANGGITLPVGIYNAYLGFNMDGSTTSITDFRMGFLTTSTNPGTTESNWTGNLPYTYLTVVSSPRNYTMYFHKTDSCDNSSADSEQFNISGCVYVDGSTILYPCVRWNRGGTNSTLQGTIIFTRIG